MMPPAPARLSITTCCPHASVKRCPIARAVKSLELPGVPGTMTRIGRAGYDCAQRFVQAQTAAAIDTNSRLRMRFRSSLSFSCRGDALERHHAHPEHRLAGDVDVVLANERELAVVAD